MSLQKFVLLVILALATESHSVFHNLLTRLIPSGGQDEYQTKLIPLGRFRLNLGNAEDLAMLPINGRGPYNPQVVSLYLRTVQPPTPREKIRMFLQGLNPFNRQPIRPTLTPSNNGFDNSYRTVATVNNLNSNQWTPIIPGKVNLINGPKYYRNYPMDLGNRNNWGASTGDPGDLKILGPNFKILLNHRNQQLLQEARNARHLTKSNYDTTVSDLISSFRPSSSFGMASEYVSPVYGNKFYNDAENSYSNYDNSDSYKVDLENNSVTQDEDYSDLSTSVSPPRQQYNNQEPLTYMVPPPIQSNNNIYSYNPNYESGYTNGPSYATRFITNPVRDHMWSNQYDNPFNQPYPNYLRYAGWNHRVDSVEPQGRKYTTIPYSVNIPPHNRDKLMEKSDVQGDSTEELTTMTENETSSDTETMITGDDLSSIDKVERNSNDLSDEVEPYEIGEEIPLF